MKTAQDWKAHFEAHFKATKQTDEEIWQSMIAQIQLDAMKEGMRRAADKCEWITRTGHVPVGKQRIEEMSATECKTAILTASEQLSENDL